MVFFRADGNSKIGAGHVMRCLSIASAIKELHEEVVFFSAETEFCDYIKGAGIENVVFKTDYRDMESELFLFEKIIKEKKPNYIFVDSYFVTRNYLQRIQEVSNSYGGKLIYIDDVLAFAYPCDYLINYNIYAPNMKNRYLEIYNGEGMRNGAKGYPIFLLGTKYLPLRKEFINLPVREINNKIDNVFVSTGGADFEHIALAFVKYVKSKQIKKVNFHIIIGLMNEDKAEIEQLANGCDNLILHYDVKDMVKLMQSCDIAISAAGSTLYELCATQTPTITYVIADNQIMAAEAFEKKGIMKYAGDVRQIGTLKLLEKMFSLISKLEKNRLECCEMAKRQYSIIDSRGWLSAFEEIKQ